MPHVDWRPILKKRYNRIPYMMSLLKHNQTTGGHFKPLVDPKRWSVAKKWKSILEPYLNFNSTDNCRLPLITYWWAFQVP